MLFRRETAYADMCFLAALFLTHHPENVLAVTRREISRSSDCGETMSHRTMRYLPMLSLCAMGSMVLSPLMVSLWTEAGTGNANFLFFQGLILFLLCTVAIAELALQIISEVDGDSWCNLKLLDSLHLNVSSIHAVGVIISLGTIWLTRNAHISSDRNLCWVQACLTSHLSPHRLVCSPFLMS